MKPRWLFLGLLVCLCLTLPACDDDSSKTGEQIESPVDDDATIDDDQTDDDLSDDDLVDDDTTDDDQADDDVVDDDTVDDDQIDDDAIDDDTVDDDATDDDVAPLEETKAMTFNLRNGVALDGENSWPFRRDIVTNLIALEMPAVMGVQEAWKFQLDYIKDNVPGYDWVGISRMGNQLDEYCAVFYRTDHFVVLNTGTFWLSDTPDVPRSRFSANQLCPRIVTWAELEILGDGRVFFIFNTHFDTTNLDEVPQRSAALLVEQIDAIAGDAPALVSGDFNELVDSDAHRILTGEMEYNGTRGDLLDPWSVLGLTEEGTSHSFNGIAPAPSRIDWILCTEDFVPLAGEVLHYEEDGHYPSDHFPVTVTFDAFEPE